MIDDLIRAARVHQRRAVAWGMVCAAVAALSAVGLLAVSGWFLTGSAIAGLAGAAAVKAFNYLIPSAAIRGLAILRTLSRYGERLFSHQAMLFALASVRAQLFARLVTSPPRSALSHDRGEVAARLGEDVQTLEEAFLRTTVTPSGIATLLGATLLAGLSGIGPALALVGAALLSAFVTRRIGATRIGPAFADESAAMGQLKRRYIELAAGGDDLLVYGLGADVQHALRDAATPLAQARARLARADLQILVAHWTLTAAAVIAVLFLSHASAPIIALSALAVVAAMEIVGALARLDLQRWKSRDARARLAAMFAENAPEQVESTAPDAFVEIHLGGASHAIRPGDRIALIGASGSGKTRLLETLCGLRDDAPEDVMVGGIRAQHWPLVQRRMSFALAAQDAAMIAGTVADNLALARPGLDRDAMQAALAIACVDDVVAALPGGLDCWLGEDGARLSGGQRKRLSLARALLADRPFLLLDEPSEGLDSITEARLIAKLDDWLHQTGRGLILVSHRPAMLALTQRQLNLGA